MAILKLYTTDEVPGEKSPDGIHAVSTGENGFETYIVENGVRRKQASSDYDASAARLIVCPRGGGVSTSFGLITPRQELNPGIIRAVFSNIQPGEELFFGISGGIRKVNWGDGSYNDYAGTGAASHVYSAGGDYTVLIKLYSNVVSFNFFSGKTKLRTVEFADNGLVFEHSVFFNCSNLEMVDIKQPHSIAHNVFYNCDKLTGNIDLTDVRELSDSVFRESSFNTIRISSPHIKAVGHHMFYTNKNIKKIYLPPTITATGDYSFSAASLEELHFTSANPPSRDMPYSSLGFLNNNCKIYVPAGSRAAYLASNLLADVGGRLVIGK